MPADRSAPLRLFNSLTREIEEFAPVHGGEARVYSCGPTVYNYQHIGNMRAYIFADTLGRTLSWKGHDLTHIINITDVGHLTSDADLGDDKMEKAASEAGKSAWDIAAHYTEAFQRDIERLNIRRPAKWSIATDHIEAMIEFAKSIADKHCYQLDTGLYFDTSTVPDYGRLARAVTDDGEGRIETVDGKRQQSDFAIWRKTPNGETRQMEWDSPWGRGAPGWHLECSVMSKQYLGEQFDIHTGGIDHREIHHPNEIAQNQAHCGSAETGANIWMHNNFLVDRRGKMSKSAGEFLTLQTLVDKGVHPLAYRLMCLQAHYRSELEFSWDNLLAALTRLKRMVIAVRKLIEQADAGERGNPVPSEMIDAFDREVSDDLATPQIVSYLDIVLGRSDLEPASRLEFLKTFDAVLGLDLLTLTRVDLRICPNNAAVTEEEIDLELDRRETARAAKDFATADTIRDELFAQGVEIMDGDSLRWEWRIMP